MCFSCATDNQRKKARPKARGISAGKNAVVALGGSQAAGAGSKIGQMIAPDAEVGDATIQFGDAGNTKAHGYEMYVLSNLLNYKIR